MCDALAVAISAHPGFSAHAPVNTEAQRTLLFEDVGWGGLRLAIVVLGGLLVLQSSDELDALKLAYLVAAAAAFAGALYNLAAGPARKIARRYLPLLALDAALFALLGSSFIVARINGTSSSDWLRDAVAYGLFAAVPILAIDAAVSSTRRFLTAFLIVVGVLASVSTAVEWLGRRDIADLPFDRLVMPGGQLAVALYGLALAAAFTHRTWPSAWSALAGVILGLSLVTGTRSSLLLLLIPLAMAVVVRPRKIGYAARVVGIHLVVALVIFAGVGFGLHDRADPPPVAATAPGVSSMTPVPSSQATPEAEAGADGPSALERLLAIGLLAQDPARDASVKERVAQYSAAWELFASSPIVGVGPGHPINWNDVSNLPRDDFTADTPLVLPAKLGIIGTVLAALLAVAYVRLVAGLVRDGGWRAETLAMFGYGAFALVTVPLSMPIEGKAFSFALALLLALALTSASAEEPDSRRIPA